MARGSNSTAEYNRIFGVAASKPETKTKLASSTTVVIQEKAREGGIMRRIMPTKTISMDDPNIQVSKNSDTWGYRIWLAPDAHARSITFRGQPDSRYVSAGRFDIGFYRISTLKYQKHRSEMAVYPYNIMKAIESLFPNAMQNIEDRNWLANVEQSCQDTDSVIKSEGATTDIADNGANTGDIFPLQRADFVALKQHYADKKRRLEVILINEHDYMDLSYWGLNELGEFGSAKATVDGFEPATIMGIPLVRTMKTDLLVTGNLYGFADLENLGRAMWLQEPKFYVDEKDGVVSWWADEELTCYLAQVINMVKMETYNADSMDIPDEEDIDTDVYNRVSDGIYFPAWNANN